MNNTSFECMIKIRRKTDIKPFVYAACFSKDVKISTSGLRCNL